MVTPAVPVPIAMASGEPTTLEIQENLTGGPIEMHVNVVRATTVCGLTVHGAVSLLLIGLLWVGEIDGDEKG
jgi:hypothetical protein